MTAPIACTINGGLVERAVEPCMSLADWLRDDLELTGTHLACEQGVCGSCTVLVDGDPVRSCLMLAVQADAREVRTIEGVAPSVDELHPLQRHLVDALGFQCGFCASGFVMSILGLVDDLPPVPQADDVRELLAGNLCRCTGYSSIVDAVLGFLRERSAAER